MKIKLGLDILKEIVEDGIKEIKSKLNFGTRQRVMSRDTLMVIDKYRDLLAADFLPALVSDFGEDVEVKFSGGRMVPEEVKKIKEFIDMVKKSDTNSYKVVLVDGIKKVLISEDHAVRVSKIAEEGHCQIMQRIELYIRREIMDSVYRQTVERCNLESTIYNFTEMELPDYIKEFFKNGVDAVPRMKLTRQEVKDRTEDALLEYLERFRWRQRKDPIKANSIPDWLQKAIERETNSESADFYIKIQGGYSGMLNELDLLYTDSEVDSESQIRKKLEIDGCVIVPCDKKMGMSLFTLETMRRADTKLMEQLGATLVDISKEDILENVYSKIEEFEDNLDIDQQEYIDFAYNDRNLRGCQSQIIFPFLRSTHKIHKMTSTEISEKDISKIKFRPVVDARRWVTKGYSTLIMNMMRKANQDLLFQAGPVLRDIKVKNGWRFARTLQGVEIKDGFDITFSADIQEAYTNVTAEMINKAIRHVCKFLGYPEWKMELMTKLIDLVLSNNYAEMSTGHYRFKKVLPMGYNLSGDALDIVALSGEMERMFHLGRHGADIPGMPIGELVEYPEEIFEYDVDRVTRMASSIKTYKRYVDDTYVNVVGGSVQEIVAGILAVGFMFPSGLTVNLVLNIWRAEFLDVVSWKNIASKDITTMVKRNATVPFGHVKKNSDHPKMYKMGSLLGEMLRNRRIASDEDIVELCDECTGMEFQSIGYGKKQVMQAMERARSKIDVDYSGEYVKYENEEEVSSRFYGGSLEYNGLYKYQEVLTGFIYNCKPCWAPGMLLVPGKKVKNFAYTKNQYLKRQREELGVGKSKFGRK